MRVPLRPGRVFSKPFFRTVIVVHQGDVLGGGLKSRAEVRWLGAAGLMFACLVALPGQAGADDPLPTISVNDVSKPEGQTLDFKFTLSAAAAADVTVTAATSGGSGYTARNETVTIPAGQTSANFDIATQGNDLDEPDRQLIVTLSGQSENATIADPTGAGTITDDDATPTIAISGPPPISEGAVTRGVHGHDDRQVGVRHHRQLCDRQWLGDRGTERGLRCQERPADVGGRRDWREVLRRPDS